MRIVFMGTNGWYDTAQGNTVSVLIQGRDLEIVLDAGNGIYKLDRYTGGKSPLFLLLSHFHLDHIVGLHILAKFSPSRGLTISGPEGTRGVLNTIVNSPFSMPLGDLPYSVEVLELPGERERLPFTLECGELLHTSLTLGYRIRLEGKTIAYCPDTGYCENAVRLARGADLLIAECSFRPGESHREWPHLNPLEAARIAREAGAGRLALIHFDASRYLTWESRKEAELRARDLFPDTVASRDDLEMEL